MSTSAVETLQTYGQRGHLSVSFVSLKIQHNYIYKQNLLIFYYYSYYYSSLTDQRRPAASHSLSIIDMSKVQYISKVQTCIDKYRHVQSIVQRQCLISHRNLEASVQRGKINNYYASITRIDILDFHRTIRFINFINWRFVFPAGITEER